MKFINFLPATNKKNLLENLTECSQEVYGGISPSNITWKAEVSVEDRKLKLNSWRFAENGHRRTLQKYLCTNAKYVNMDLVRPALKVITDKTTYVDSFFSTRMPVLCFVVLFVFFLQNTLSIVSLGFRVYNTLRLVFPPNGDVKAVNILVRL